MMLGTILPSAKTERESSRAIHAEAAKRYRAQDRLIAQGLLEVGANGETRLYTPDMSHYAIITRRLTAQWFRATAQGDFACKDPRTFAKDSLISQK